MKPRRVEVLIEVESNMAIVDLDAMGYVTNQYKSGLKEGDRVKITHKAEDYQGGWSNIWTHLMNDEIGKEFIIEEVTYKWDIRGTSSSGGIKLVGSAWLYPYFVLEKVEPCDFIKVELVIVKRKGRWIRP